MSAQCPIYVRVAKLKYEWAELSAVTLEEACARARELPDVIKVDEESATYRHPENL